MEETKRNVTKQKQNSEDHALDEIEHQYARVSKPKQNELQQNTLNTETSYYNLNSKDVEKAKAARQEVYYDFTPIKKPSPTSVNVDEFKEYVEVKKSDSEFLPNQFKELFTGLQFQAKNAVLSRNIAKNKYKNIYPYDDSRVKLSDDFRTDYINASYIHGYGQVKSYIAAQGPLKNTLQDFWQMVWKENCGKIVMLTNVMEDGKEKCIQYWPDTDKMTIGDFDLELMDTETFADFTIRTFSLSKKSDSHTVKHFHFTAWPDKGVPIYASSLVHFRSKVLHSENTGRGPIVVHCSAGVGRTGTFISLDYLVKQADDTGFVDVFGCVETLRRQRANMVQTMEQYVFLHYALLEALMCKSSNPSAAEFPEMYEEMLAYDTATGKQNFQIQYENLCSSSPEIPVSAFSVGKSADNKKKNRYSNIIPVDSEIPKLIVLEGCENYINAVVLPAYRSRSSFIVTQMPMKNTVLDFWRLIYTHHVSTIVMLNDTSHGDNEDIGIYWPQENDTINIEPFSILVENTLTDNEGYDVVNIDYTFQEKQQRRVSIFRQRFWEDGLQIPRSISVLLEFINGVGLHHERHNSGPIVVHCINGADKSGLFCVLQVVLERLKIEQDVAINQIIKQMRSSRPQIITTLEQFKFCHEAVMEFLTQNETYSNFQ